MSTQTQQNFTASAAGIVLGTQHFGPVEGLALADLRAKNPAAWVVFQEFAQNGTVEGVVTVTAG